MLGAGLRLCHDSCDTSYDRTESESFHAITSNLRRRIADAGFQLLNQWRAISWSELRDGSIAGEIGVPMPLLARQRLAHCFRLFSRVEMSDAYAIISLSLDLGLDQIAIVALDF